MVNRFAKGALIFGLGLLGPGLLSTGCEEKKVPEYILQQRRKEAKLAKLRAEQAKEKKPPREEDLWPATVREAYYRLILASEMQVTPTAQSLARQGQQAVPALKFLLNRESVKSKRKRGVVSFMLVDLHMFRPQGLAQLAQERQHPIVQRAAIEALVRIGSENSVGLLKAIRKEAEGGKLDRPTGQVGEPGEGGGARVRERARGGGHGHGGHGHGHNRGEEPPLGPLTAFIDQMPAREVWGYSDEQLNQLDGLLQARLPAEVEGALRKMTDLSLEKGLLYLLRSPVVLSATQRAVADKLVALHGGQVRQLCAPDRPMLLRVRAAVKLIEGGDRGDLAFLKKLASSKKEDPFSVVLTRLLSSDR